MVDLVAKSQVSREKQARTRELVDAEIQLLECCQVSELLRNVPWEQAKKCVTRAAQIGTSARRSRCLDHHSYGRFGGKLEGVEGEGSTHP